MPIAAVFEEPRTFVVTCTGDVSYEEASAVIAEMAAHPRLAKGVNMLADCREVTGAPSTVELRRLAGELRPLLTRTGGGVAIVTSELWVYGIARMFAVFAELANARVQAFRDMYEARSWLAAADRGGNAG